MGKIVKNANFDDGRYVVGVPRVEASRVAPPVDEFDERFASAPVRGPRIEEEEAFLTPMAPAQPEIDWEALQSDADAIVDRASADAQALISEARVRALELVEQAEASAAGIRSDARTEGYDEGFTAGKAAADAEMTAMLETMRSLIESAREERRFVVESAEPEVLKLAMAIAERIVHEEIDRDPNVVVENVRHALTRLVSREVVTLRVHPADLDALRHHRDALVSSSDIEHLRIVEDQRVDRGGVVVETDAGTIDAKISTQLREARRAIMADDAIALGQAHDENVGHSPAQAS